jgi:hypothetical protein
MRSNGTAAVLSTGSRRPFIRENIRKAFSTGLSIPPLASERKPAKSGWSSKLKVQVNDPSRFAPPPEFRRRW